MTGTVTGRRTVLASAAGVPLTIGAGGLAALAGVASGCAGGAAATPETRQSAAPAVPGAALRARAARDSTELLARYDGLIAARPELTARLAPLRAEVARHAQAFGSGGSSPKPSPATGGGTPSGTPSASGTSGTSGTTAAPAALGALAEAERRLADARATALLDAPPELARLLASVAAAGAAHVILLTGKG
ncbi:hypothetical protein QMK19_25490 [Streptomyces sp. H10-C2]|uniref:hypothetical protein n=1 Tax=unclassified Streptomyces TaxID=2593676 RepID=UPI0024B92944|nr:MULTISPECIES: hypothetical protein [unclassified Streptomyces]MDJ0343295.1 hypothetical protein [Streptomyces sp. PH10-H1]MDJ0372920.1 hypothetical protein [Streptomyces sp. H10-C2]